MSGRVQNSDSIGRLIARELRSGNRLHPCDQCRREKPTRWVGDKSLCEDCSPKGAGQ